VAETPGRPAARVRSQQAIAVLLLQLLAVGGAYGCTYDVAKLGVRATMEPVEPRPVRVLLSQVDLDLPVQAGRIRIGSRWQLVGEISQGEVFRGLRPPYAIVAGPNAHEAHLVVDQGAVVGLYLPIEDVFLASGAKISILWEEP
jgi:hypothetical protein